MAGFIVGAMRRGLAEAGGVAEQVGIRALQSELDGMRQERLLQLQEASQARRDERQNKFTAEQNDASRQVTRDEGKATRDTQIQLASDTNARIEREGKATRASQEKIASEHDKSAERRHSESIALQRQQVGAAVRAADLAYQKGEIELAQAKRVKELHDKYQAATDPAERERIADEIYTLAGKDKIVMGSVRNEDGTTTPVPYNARTGQPIVNRSAPDQSDPLGLRSGLPRQSTTTAPPPASQGAPLVTEPPMPPGRSEGLLARKRREIEEQRRREEELKKEYGDSGY